MDGITYPVEVKTSWSIVEEKKSWYLYKPYMMVFHMYKLVEKQVNKLPINISRQLRRKLAKNYK